MKNIKVSINSDGEIKMEGSGFVGTACDKAMAALEKSLGTQTKRINKPEYYQQATGSNTQSVGGGK
jgi:hypothetical protein